MEQKKSFKLLINTIEIILLLLLGLFFYKNFYIIFNKDQPIDLKREEQIQQKDNNTITKVTKLA